MLTRIKRTVKIVKVKLQNKCVKIEADANFSTRTIFHGQNKLGRGSWLDGEIGYGSYVGINSTISAKIGKYCCIANNVSILTGRHPTDTFVSLSPVFYSLEKQNGTTYTSKQKFDECLYADNEKKFNCIIGNDVWIGSNVLIMGGCTIGDGAVIAAGAVVNRDVEPYSIVGGVPAKVIKKRFSDSQINELQRISWWNLQTQWIVDNSNLFENIDLFLSKFNDGKLKQ